MACKHHYCFGRRYVTTVLRDQSVVIRLSGRCCEIRCIKSNHSPTLQHWGGTNVTRLQVVLYGGKITRNDMNGCLGGVGKHCLSVTPA